MKNEVIYKVITKHEIPELSKIEKSNITAEITLADTLKAIEDNAKGMEQIRAEVNLKKALMTNVSENYPEVLTIDPKMQIAIHTYYEASRYVDLGEQKLKEFDEAQKELQNEVEEIERQTGVRKMTQEEKNALITGGKDIIKVNKKKNAPRKKCK